MAPTPSPPIVRVMRRVRIATADGCWEWTGHLTQGYGSVGVGGGKHRPAHRVTYTHYIGPIPDGLVIDHLCRNRACCNPAHMEPVTPGENVRRGDNHHRDKTHCPHGHPYDEANTYRYKDGSRGCRTCARERERRKRVALTTNG